MKRRHLLGLGGVAVLGAALSPVEKAVAAAGRDAEPLAIKPRLIAKGLAWPEGPVAEADGSLLITEIFKGQLTRIAPDGAASVVAKPGDSPDGLARGPNGVLYICNSGKYPPPSDPARPGRVERISRDGKLERFLIEAGGEPLNAPNDIVFDVFGNMYFTDPKLPQDADRWSVALPAGIVFAQTDGHTKRIDLGMRIPNGIAISPDGKFLLVIETQTRQIHRMKIQEPGVLGPAKIFAELRDGLPDGMKFDEEGYLLVGAVGSGMVQVFAPSGHELVETIMFPEKGITNLCFGGADFKTVFVTESLVGGVYNFEWRRRGAKLFSDRARLAHKSGEQH